MAKNGLKKEQKNCILEEGKICDNCCECFICELDPTKICDNCAKCLGLNKSDEVEHYDPFIFEDDDFNFEDNFEDKKDND